MFVYFLAVVFLSRYTFVCGSGVVFYDFVNATVARHGVPDKAFRDGAVVPFEGCYGLFSDAHLRFLGGLWP